MATNLVQRVEAAVGATGAEAACQRLCRAAEQGAGQVIGETEVGIVEDIEELRAEIEAPRRRMLRLPQTGGALPTGPETSREIARTGSACRLMSRTST